MFDKYITEVRRFIERSVEHLRWTGKQGFEIAVETKDENTGERYRTRITIEKIEEEDEH